MFKMLQSYHYSETFVLEWWFLSDLVEAFIYIFLLFSLSTQKTSNDCYFKRKTIKNGVDKINFILEDWEGMFVR